MQRTLDILILLAVGIALWSMWDMRTTGTQDATLPPPPVDLILEPLSITPKSDYIVPPSTGYGILMRTSEMVTLDDWASHAWHP